MVDDLINGPHWAFSLAVYNQDAVPSACLFLQDTYGVDVNVLLLGLYGASRLNIDLTKEEIAALDALVREFREFVVVPLRSVRRWLKGTSFAEPGDAIRNQVKEAELRAEQLEQAVIAKWMTDLKRMPATSSLSVTAERIVRNFANQPTTTNVRALNSRAQEAIETIVAAAASAGSRL
jgi:uncharacterized protein (TIGR02444 family)